MPYLKGIGGTGKSLILSVVDAIFAKGAVATLGTKREAVFGMANLVGTQVILGRDMPKALSGVLQQEMMQAMTSGETMEIPMKGLKAEFVTWRTPVVMASNHLPDYINTGNNVGRRLVTLRFDNAVTDTTDGLQQAILKGELPNIVCRGLAAYHALRARVAQTKGGFWKAVPAKMVEWQGKLAVATNRVHEFLDMDDDERGYVITMVPGRITSLTTFKAAFENCMGCKYVADEASFAFFGYNTSDSKKNVCKSCRGLASADPRCCGSYNHDNRSKLMVIMNMEMNPVCLFGDGV